MRFLDAVLVLALCSIREHTSSADYNSSANSGDKIWNSMAELLCNMLLPLLIGGSINNNISDNGCSNHQMLSETLGNCKEELLLTAIALPKCK